jgi:hypothetical protein
MQIDLTRAAATDAQIHRSARSGNRFGASGQDTTGRGCHVVPDDNETTQWRSTMKIKKLNSGNWNNGDLAQLPCRMRREQVAVQTTLAAPSDEAFGAVLSAVSGALGAGGPKNGDANGDAGGDGDAELRHPGAGDCETHALWSERQTGRLLFGDPGLVTHAYVTRCDPAERTLHVALLNPERAMGLLCVALTPRHNATQLALELTYSAVSEAGNALFAPELAERMRGLLAGLGTALQEAANQGRQRRTEPARRARRKTVSESMVVRADADLLFPYACPVAELEWIEDWQFDLIHSVSGKNELHNIFLEPFSGALVLRMHGANTYWYTTRWDPAQRQFHALLLTGDLVCAQWEFHLQDQGDKTSRLELTLTYTGLSEAGDRLLAEPDFADRMRQMLRFVLASARCYAETGTILRLSHRRKAGLALSVVGATLGRHLGRALRRLHSRA